MKTVKWTVEYSWDYDFEHIVDQVKKYIRKYNPDKKHVEEFINSTIQASIDGADDLYYLAFNEEAHDKIFNEVMKYIDLGEQLSLNI